MLMHSTDGRRAFASEQRSVGTAEYCGQVRIAVRTLTLNIFRVDDVELRRYLVETASPYFINVHSPSSYPAPHTLRIPVAARYGSVHTISDWSTVACLMLLLLHSLRSDTQRQRKRAHICVTPK